MLTIEVSLPSECQGPVRLEVCGALPDLTLYVRVRLCAYCGEAFIARIKGHKFCYDPRCRRRASENRKVESLGVGY